MAQQQASVRILAGVFTVLGLGLAWMTIVNSVPSEQELSAKEPSVPQQSVSAPTANSSEPMLDLSIPGVPPGPIVPPDHQPPATAMKAPSTVKSLTPHAAQVARLRCESEAEQLCDDVPEGPARKQCLESRMHQLPGPCQAQFRERFVKWKEERNRLTAACQVDMKRFCSAVKPGGGHVLKCLQEHAQELSDVCYQTLPKGTVYFKQ